MNHSLRYLSIAALLSCFTGSCGVTEESVTDLVKEDIVLPTPEIREVAPAALASGDTLTVLGEGFAPEPLGRVKLRLEGTFQGTSGSTNSIDLVVTPQQLNQGVLQWTFGPNIPFSPHSPETGVFRGFVHVENIGHDGETKAAARPLSVQLQVLPSIVVHQIRPVEMGCMAESIESTTENTPIMLDVEAVGLTAGSPEAPIQFVYTFLKENFNFTGYVQDQLSMDPEALFPQAGPVSVVETIQNGTRSALGRSGSPREVGIKVGNLPTIGGLLTNQFDKLFRLTHLSTSSTGPADNFDAIINVFAIDSQGRQAKRSIPIRIWTPIEVVYEGQMEVVRSYDPEPVSGCIFGGDIGRDIEYSEAHADVRERAFLFKGGITAGGSLIVRLEANLGFEVLGKASSTDATSLGIKSFVVPNQVAVFYRQALQLERRGTFRGHGPCGTTTELGQFIVKDWTWSPDVAKGKGDCPPLPKSNLNMGKLFSKPEIE